MRRADVIGILERHRDALRALGVDSLSLFGSMARDEVTERSDIDIIVDFSRPATFDAFMELRARLEDWLGARIDLVTRKALKPRLRARIEAEALRVA